MKRVVILGIFILVSLMSLIYADDILITSSVTGNDIASISYIGEENPDVNQRVMQEDDIAFMLITAAVFLVIVGYNLYKKFGKKGRKRQ